MQASKALPHFFIQEIASKSKSAINFGMVIEVCPNYSILMFENVC